MKARRGTILGAAVVCMAAVAMLAAVAAGQTETTTAEHPAQPATDHPATAPEAKAAAPTVVMEFGTEIDRQTRTVVGAAETFAPDVDRVWCLTRITGLADTDSVTHAWYHEGNTMARVNLPVRSAFWRTWSAKRILPAWTGRWEVKVLDSDGAVLHTGSFEVR